jgi:hypothetical protein
MTSCKDRIIGVTLPYTLRPKSKDREKVIAAALEFVIEEFSYSHPNVDGDHGLQVVNVKDILKLIDELRSE